MLAQLVQMPLHLVYERSYPQVQLLRRQLNRPWQPPNRSGE